ncbi:hypothetical protein [Tessaracoccus coleopterorum]|uniref:hypothetical protein n=1 Tax=Tessaracoccus coleopterorum TaxID=2714950 RepID=UPI002F90EBAA
MIASEPYLGVREANNYRFAVIATPAGPYYSEPVKLWITPNYTRAARAAPAPPSAAATTRPASSPPRRPPRTAAARCCGPTVPSTSGSRSAAR